MANNENGEQSSNLAIRTQLRKAEKYIVQDYFPCGAVHAIVGASGIGKSTLTFQWLYDWARGLNVLEKKSFPCKWKYVSADRSLLENDRTLRRIGLGDWDCPIFSLDMVYKKYESPNLIEMVKSDMDTDLWVVEGFQSFMPDVPRGRSQNKAEQLFMARLRCDYLVPYNKTIIITIHESKNEESKSSKNERSSILGSAAFIGSLGTIVKIDYPSNVKNAEGKEISNERLISVLPRDFPDVHLHYVRDECGRLIPFDEEFANSNLVQTNRGVKAVPNLRKELSMGEQEDFIATYILEVVEKVGEVKTSEISKKAVDELGWGRTKVFEFIAALVDRRQIHKTSRGAYGVGPGEILQ